MLSEWKGKIEVVPLTDKPANEADLHNFAKQIVTRYHVPNCVTLTEVSYLAVAGEIFYGYQAALQRFDFRFCIVLHFSDLLTQICSKFLNWEAQAKVIVACSTDGTNVHIYEGKLHGKIVEQKGNSNFEFECVGFRFFKANFCSQIFQPENFTKTMSEMNFQKFVLPLRSTPYLDMVSLSLR